MKKHLIFLLTFFLGLKAMAAVEPTVSLADIEMKPGTQTTVTMELQNAGYAITSLQGDFILPEGVTVSDISLVSDRFKTNGANISHVINANATRFLVTANREYGSIASVDGTSGAVISFKLNVAKTVSLGQHQIGIGNVELGDAQYQPHYASCTATLTVYDDFTVTATAADPTMGTVTGEGTYKSGKEVTVKATPNEGYSFVNWKSGDIVVSESDTYTFVVIENKNLTATFTPNLYTMTFVLNNGEENVVKKQPFGTELTAPKDFEKEGHDFAGWDSAIPETVPAGDKTFTAQWTIKQYTMTFVLNNGEENVVVTQDYGTKLAAPVPTKKGYAFAGWDKTVPSEIPSQDMTFTATWTLSTYTITYDLADGSLPEGKKNPTSYTFETDNFTLVNPMREGYNFAGWIIEGQNDPMMTVTITKGSCTGNLKFTATWTEKPAVLKGDVNGDGFIDVADVSAVTNYILGRTNTVFIDEAADLNNDGFIDVSDISAITNIILGK
jgi:uncharacterized repeat protein (TIGR02543 family)